jgi:hypothetical protein
MKIEVTFDVQGYVNEWHFAQYLADMLELPEVDTEGYHITGIDNVKIRADELPQV